MPSHRPRKARKQPLVSVHKAAAVSRKATQSTIASYHALLKKRSSLQSQVSLASESNRERLQSEMASVEDKLQELGGIEGYQHASTLGQSSQRGGDSSKVLISWLEELRDASPPWPLRNFKMLEIGALKPDNYKSRSTWIENHPIDLNSRHPDIVEQDFLERPVATTIENQFDIISCSLVLNFVGDPRDRGKMLQLCRSQLRPSPSSLLFVVLPFPCVNNSRYLTLDTFKELIESLGFRLIKEQWRPTSKVAYWLWQWDEKVQADLGRWKKKVLRNDGRKRNNFAILFG